MPTPDLPTLEAIARELLDHHRRRARLLAEQDALLYYDVHAGVVATLADLRVRLFAAEDAVLNAVSRLRALGVDIVHRDPLTLAVPGVTRRTSRFVWLDTGVAHVELVPAIPPASARRHHEV